MGNTMPTDNCKLKIKKAEEWRVSSAFRLEGILVKGY